MGGDIITQKERRFIMQTDYIDHEVLEHVLSCLMPQNELILRICITTGFKNW